MVTLTLLAFSGLMVGFSYLIVTILYWVEGGRPSNISKTRSILSEGHQLPSTGSMILWFCVFSAGFFTLMLLILTNLAPATEALQAMADGRHTTVAAVIAGGVTLVDIGLLVWLRVVSVRALR